MPASRRSFAAALVAVLLGGCGIGGHEGWSVARTGPVRAVAAVEDGAWALTGDGTVRLLARAGDEPRQLRAARVADTATALGITRGHVVAVGEERTTVVPRRGGAARSVGGWRDAVDLRAAGITLSPRLDFLDAGPVASGARLVWVAVEWRRVLSGRDNLYRAVAVAVDPARPDVRRTVPLGVALPSGLAADSGAVFAASSVWGAGGRGAVARTDLATGRVTTRSLGGAHDVVLAGGLAWVLAAGRVHRLDPRTLASRAAPLDVGEARRISAAGSTVWVHVTAEDEESVVRLERGGRELDRAEVPGYGDDSGRFTERLAPDVEAMAAHGGVVWMDELSGVVYRYRAR